MTAVATQPSITPTNNSQPSQTSAIEQAKPATLRIVTQDDSAFANLLDTAKFEHMWRVATIYAASKIVPAHCQGDRETCFVLIQMAVRLGVDPLMFMQKTFVVQGKPGMEAQMAIALVNSRGPFTGAIQWKLEGEGSSRQATAFATHKETGEICHCTVSMKIAEAEGWLGKSGSKWKTMPDQMLRYRSAAWLARLYAPECLMGMQTLDELEDIGAERQTLANLPEGRTSFRAPDVVAESVAAELVDKSTGEVTGADAAAKAKIAEQAEALKQNGTKRTLEDAAGEPEKPVDLYQARKDAKAKHGCKQGKKGCAEDGKTIEGVGYICTTHDPANT